MRLLPVLALLAPLPLRAGADGLAELRPLVDLIETVEANYAGDPRLGTQDLINEGLAGMASSLDRYSEFLDQQKYKDLQEDTRGSFGGIGIEIAIVNNRLQVLAPIEGTPAERAGLQGGDVIAQINGAPTDDMKIMAAVHRIKGVVGTKVTLTIVREGFPPKEVSMERAVITPVNIRDTVLGDVGYVAIKSFSEHTAENLAAALERFRARGVTGVILDLRGNPGGLLQEAYRVVDLFLPGGKLIVSTEGRDPAQRAKYYSTDKRAPCLLPLVVLTNEHSASGSEIVAGALQDWGRAVIAGWRTFGKASVQSIEPIKRDKSQALRMTVAHYYTPLHREIHEVGIPADVTLPPVRYPRVLRKVEDDGAFSRFAQELLHAPKAGAASAAAAEAPPASWLDAAALKDGLVRSATDKEAAAIDARIVDAFKRWAPSKTVPLTDEEWDDLLPFAARIVRIAVMRKGKGEESAK
ncbi:MAG: S41 family peptidase, partial [bacterium]